VLDGGWRGQSAVAEGGPGIEALRA